MRGSYVCGHCGVEVGRDNQVNLEKRPVVDASEGAVQWYVLSCISCGGYTLYAASGAPRFFPPEGHRRTPNIDKVPQLIRADYEEAVDSLVGGQHKAAAVMSRRAIQGVCLDLGAKPKDRLVDQIDALAESGEITERLAGLAHKVRGIGNDGAHPRDDGIDEMTPDEAKQALDFLEHLLQHVYIIDSPEEAEKV